MQHYGVLMDESFDLGSSRFLQGLFEPSHTHSIRKIKTETIHCLCITHSRCSLLQLPQLLPTHTGQDSLQQMQQQHTTTVAVACPCCKA